MGAGLIICCGKNVAKMYRVVKSLYSAAYFNIYKLFVIRDFDFITQYMQSDVSLIHWLLSRLFYCLCIGVANVYVHFSQVTQKFKSWAPWPLMLLLSKTNHA
jgi:hypothetical protein